MLKFLSSPGKTGGISMPKDTKQPASQPIGCEAGCYHISHKR